MARTDFRPWAALALCAAVLGYVGCTSSTSTTHPSPASSPKDRAAGPKAGAPDDGSGSKVLANLGNPAAVLLFTGEMNGYIEPCGCTENQIGGLIRRYDFLERLKKQGWPAAAFDLGGLTLNPSVARGGFEQAKIKFDYAIRALKLLDYRAVALSAEDMKAGVSEALALFLNGLGDSAKILAANVEPPSGFESMFKASLVVPAGSAKVGVTAVIDPGALEKLNDSDKDLLVAGLKRPVDVLPKVLAELEPKSDYQVLMVQGPPKLARSLAESYPGFDIVVATSEIDDILHEPDALNGGKTLFVQVGHKGKYVGAVGLYPDASERMKFARVALNGRFDGPADPMRKLIRDEYRDTLRQIGVVENFPRHDFVNGVSGATYVGADNCKSCHPNTYMKWSTTKHFLAYESLLKDEKPNVIYDAECVTCHTTGFEYNSGWKSASATPYLKGNQCENCHGPGSKHVEDPDNKQYLAAMALTPEKADKNQLCQHCHDGDNSPKFDFGTYYPKIAHKGLDEYKDPKVHRGITPKLAGSGPSASEGASAHQ